jgi:flagellar biosynthesis/type III secretory pathway M-ring protein FliF/YscJ
MAEHSKAWRIAIFAVVALGALVVLIATFANLAALKIRLALAAEQTAVFDEMREKAETAAPEEAVGYLQYAVNYYPSGTKQIAGSRLDEIVERARRNAVREIIAGLREKTGEDYGDDPRQWIEVLQEKE